MFHTVQCSADLTEDTAILKNLMKQKKLALPMSPYKKKNTQICVINQKHVHK